MSKAQGIALRRSGVICDHADHDRARTESRTDAGSVNTGSYWRDRGPGARPTALHRSEAICDYADRGRRRRFAAVATPTIAVDLRPIAAPGSRGYRSTISRYLPGMRERYPAIEPQQHGMLPAGDGHDVYWE